MKKIYSLIMVSAIALTANAQLVINENFTTYTDGNLDVQGGWVPGAGTPDVQVASTTPLTYPGYISGTRYATVSSVDGKDPHKLFSTPPVNTSSDVTFFMSFVIRVSAAEASDGAPAYSLALINTADPDLPLRFYVSSEPGNASQIRFGILTGNSNNVNNIAWTPLTDSYTINTTYLIVIRYDIASAAGNNDDAYLWVNPSLASEPNGTANATLLNANEANFGDLLDALRISQTDGSPDAAYDGFRVAYGTSSALAWSNLSPAGAPLPVQLTSFNASEESFGTKLIWNTLEESGIVSYVIEKSTDGKNFTAIGTVKAANLRSYSFTDAQSSDNSYYRLKMVELDGTYKYSFIVSIKAKLSTNISLSPNPVKNMLMIQHPKAGTAGHIQIISATGQLIRDIRLSANAVISNVDMNGLTNGLYHVIYKNGSDMFSKTVLKQ
jgi:hypothetical protein